MVGHSWDKRFERPDYIFGTEPNTFLVEQSRLLPPGARILLPGDGEGRNGVWLAERGFEVVSVDASAVGLAKARELAESRGVSMATEVADLLAWRWPVGSFDAVVSIFLHFSLADRPLIHAHMLDALRPNGLVILESFRPEQLGRTSGGPRDPAMLYTLEDLKEDFRNADLLVLEQASPVLDEGPFHQGPAKTVRMVARKK